ncbi:MAG: c-type cytochrome [Planctomycetes bacterium]|nr:c-type cytochrome [Planctomycetota bacterium]
MHDFGLSEEAAGAISAYLWQQPPPPGTLPFPPKDSSFHQRAPGPAREAFDDPKCWDCHVYSGRRLVESLGCLACHEVEGRGGKAGPDLSRVGEKLRYPYLRHWLQLPAVVRPDTAMPDFRLGAGEARVIAAYLSERIDVNYPGCSPGEIEEEVADLVRPDGAGGFVVVDPRRAEGLRRRKAEQEELEQAFWKAWERREAETVARLERAEAARTGKALIQSIGCAKCHAIQGLEAAETARAPLGGRGWEGFAERHVAAGNGSRTESGAVPHYVLTPIESEQLKLVLRMLGERAAESGSLLGAPRRERDLVEGRELLDRGFCTACHVVAVSAELVPAPIASWVPEDSAAPDGCPPLTHEGARVYRAWLAEFLSAPRTIRPKVGVCMPTYALTERECGLLADFFRALDGRHGQEDPFAPVADADTRERAGPLFEKHRCSSCHLPAVDAKGAARLEAPLVSPMRDRLLWDWTRSGVTAADGMHKGVTLPGPPPDAKGWADLALYVLARPKALVDREKGYSPGIRPSYHGR